MTKPDVALVSMPFAFADLPSIGLSLLEQELAAAGFQARIHYFTLQMAAEIGMPLYTRISTQPGISCLAGESIFSGEVFEPRRLDVDGYVENILRRTTFSQLADRTAEEEFIDGVLRTRERADLFLASCLELVLAESPRIVGFTSVFQQHTASLALAKRVKIASPETLIVFRRTKLR